MKISYCCNGSHSSLDKLVIDIGDPPLLILPVALLRPGLWYPAKTWLTVTLTAAVGCNGGTIWEERISEGSMSTISMTHIVLLRNVLRSCSSWILLPTHVRM